MNGVLIVNKPQGVTSRDVVNKVGKIFKTKKVGHAGTLDPMATGVLVICIGAYTKLVPFLTSREKEYLATMQLGIKTDTGDVMGNIIERRKSVASESLIQDAFLHFPKEYVQQVPIYSAVKVNGKKLYEYAREGKEVLLPQKKVFISHLELLDISQSSITFSTCVSKGTYIRSLIEDIAFSFGELATMSSLVRTKSGDFSLRDCKELENLDETTPLLHLEDLFSYKKIVIGEDILKKVSNGNLLTLDCMEERVLLMYQNTAVALYERRESVYHMLFKVI